MTDFQLPLSNCCPKADGTSQPTPGCGCPTIQVVFTTIGYVATLVGWQEVSLSSPPRAYRHYTVGGGGISYFITDDVALTTVYSESLTPGLTTAPSWGWNAGSGVEENISAEDYSSSTGSPPAILGASLAAVNVVPILTNGQTFNLFRSGVPTALLQTVTITGPTTFKVKGNNSSAIVTAGGGGIHQRTGHIDGGEMDVTLVDEDTDDNALLRALLTPPFEEFTSSTSVPDGGDIEEVFTSILENRNNAGWSFLSVKSTYVGIISGLIPGLTYKVTRKIAERTAVNDLANGDTLYGSTWTIVSTLEDTFVADAPQKVLWGTGSDANSDGVIGTDEVTPGTDLDVTKGKETTIASIFCEWVPPS